jgi:hypothetical protein
MAYDALSDLKVTRLTPFLKPSGRRSPNLL